MHSVESHSAEQTRALGAKLAIALTQLPAERSLVIALNGELGAGKTTFVGGFLRALGVTGSTRSPTYTLIEPYDLGVRTVYHIDLYRLSGAGELEMLAPRDLLMPGSVLLVEWAERGGQALPKPDLTLTLSYPSDARYETRRIIELLSATTAGKELAASLQAPADEAGVSL